MVRSGKMVGRVVAGEEHWSRLRQSLADHQQVSSPSGEGTSRSMAGGYSGTGTDIVFCCSGGHRVRAHRSVLEKSTDFFGCYFPAADGGGLEDCVDAFGNLVFILPDVHAAVLRHCISVLYTGSTATSSVQMCQKVYDQLRQVFRVKSLTMKPQRKQVDSIINACADFLDVVPTNVMTSSSQPLNYANDVTDQDLLPLGNVTLPDDDDNDGAPNSDPDYEPMEDDDNDQAEVNFDNDDDDNNMEEEEDKGYSTTIRKGSLFKSFIDFTEKFEAYCQSRFFVYIKTKTEKNNGKRGLDPERFPMERVQYGCSLSTTHGCKFELRLQTKISGISQGYRISLFDPRHNHELSQEMYENLPQVRNGKLLDSQMIHYAKLMMEKDMTDDEVMDLICSETLIKVNKQMVARLRGFFKAAPVFSKKAKVRKVDNDSDDDDDDDDDEDDVLASSTEIEMGAVFRSFASFTAKFEAYCESHYFVCVKAKSAKNVLSNPGKRFPFDRVNYGCAAGAPCPFLLKIRIDRNKKCYRIVAFQPEHQGHELTKAALDRVQRRGLSDSRKIYYAKLLSKGEMSNEQLAKLIHKETGRKPTEKLLDKIRDIHQGKKSRKSVLPGIEVD